MRLLEEFLKKAWPLAPASRRSDQGASAGGSGTAIVVLFVTDRISLDAAFRPLLGLDRQLWLVGERHRVRCQLLQFLFQLPLVDQVLLQ